MNISDGHEKNTFNVTDFQTKTWRNPSEKILFQFEVYIRGNQSATITLARDLSTQQGVTIGK